MIITEMLIPSNKTSVIKLSTNANGMTIFIKQEKNEVEMTIDQATKMAVEILTHCQKMADTYLK